MSLMLELRATKDVSSLKFQASKDKEAVKEDYQKALEVIFVYCYGCCMFKHNICGSQPEVLDGMPDSFDPLPPEFFVNPRCPRSQQLLRRQQPRWILSSRPRILRRMPLLGIRADFALFSSPLPHFFFLKFL